MNTANDPIVFNAKLFKIDNWELIKLPKEASLKIPTRGQARIKGKINGFSFETTLEPDGKGSHWFKVDKKLKDAAKLDAQSKIGLQIEPTKTWPEPRLPADFSSALNKHPKALKVWQDITPMARWEWLRWIDGTAQSQTRARRIETACSKLTAGDRRPCCFNTRMCCVPEVSKSGILRDSSPIS